MLKTEKSGNDLIVTFNGSGNGMTENNFVAKLLGKTKEGKLLFGFARLPWLTYIEPALSPRLPQFDKSQNGYDISVEVQNFGQVPSASATVNIGYVKNREVIKVASGQIPPLKPFQKISVDMHCGDIFNPGTAYTIHVAVPYKDQKPAVLQQEMVVGE